MILIISSEDDKSTSEIIDWLLYYKANFFRINPNFTIQFFNFEINSTYKKLVLQINGINYELDDFSIIWYRRGNIDLKPKLRENIFVTQLENSIKKQIEREFIILQDLIFSEICGNNVNHPSENLLSKIEFLKLCKEFELMFPDTIVTTVKNELLIFKRKHLRIINKSIASGVFVKSENHIVSSLTTEVTDMMINDLESNFYPMMFQELIQKLFELRVFYLDGMFFASAIFSQADIKTKIDFRNYNYDKPNRVVPFKLPSFVRTKLVKVFNKLNLKSCSIDILVNLRGEYIFLEVNPIGQFSQVSRPCNYYIEEYFAKYLIENSKNRHFSKKL